MWRSAPLVLLAACASAGGTAVDSRALPDLESILEDDAANLEHAESPGYRPLDTRTDVRRRIMTQGPIVRTERDLDLAIDGAGFFRVLQQDNTLAFTRAGNFTMDSQGNLKLREGCLLVPQTVISQNFTRVLVDATGLIQGYDPQQPGSFQSIGRIELTRFRNPEALETSDGILFRESPAAGDRIDGQPAQGQGLGAIRQGFVELSSLSRIAAAAMLDKHRRQFDVVSAVVLGR